MQRIKKVDDIRKEEVKPRWRKLGGGTHTMRDGTRVKTGEIVCAWEWELTGVLDLFDCLDPQIVEEEEEEEELVTLKIVHRGGAYFDVVNPVTGERINERALKREQAEILAGCPVDTKLDDKVKEVLDGGTDTNRKEKSEEVIEETDTEDTNTEDLE